MRLAVISGGSRGLGAALCALYKGRGYEVVEFSRSAPHDFSARVDLSEPQSAALQMSDVIRPFSSRKWQEILVFNNAGTIQPVGPVSQKERRDIIGNINVNFTSGILFLAEVIAQFQEHNCKKSIINISSGAARNARAGWSLYCAAKSGMVQFIQTLALEQKNLSHPFTVINLNPGVMDTGMQAVIRELGREDFPDVELFRKRKEHGELHSAREVASEIARTVENYHLESGSFISLTF